LSFKPKPWFEIPEFSSEVVAAMQEKRKQSIEGRAAYLKLLHDEKRMGV